jgi:hypothetical protein
VNRGLKRRIEEIPMKNAFGRILTFVVIFGAMWFGLMQIPAVGALKVDLHGFVGYALLVGAAIGGSFVASGVSSFTRGFVGDEFASSPVVYVAAKTFWYLCFGGVIATLGKFAPQYVTVVGAIGLYWLLGAMGLAVGVSDIVERRFFPRNAKK